MGAGHPECPERLEAIENRLHESGLAAQLARREAPQAELSDLLRAHDGLLIAQVQALSQRAAQGRDGVDHVALDPDTSVNPHTWAAALRAAGAAVAATDAVLRGEMENAFCAVRPPGHHATRSQAMGFVFSTTWQWPPCMRWSRADCSGWSSLILMFITATAPRTSWPAMSAF